MTTFLLLIACGIVGGLLFFFLHIPGGAMLGAVVAVLAFHLVRIYIVLLVAPILEWLLNRLLPHG